MESQPQNSEFRINPEKFNPWGHIMCNVWNCHETSQATAGKKGILLTVRCNIGHSSEGQELLNTSLGLCSYLVPLLTLCILMDSSFWFDIINFG